MREQTTVTTVYTFDELSERAKDTAREWFRRGYEFSDSAECVIEDASRMADIIGINLRGRTVRLMGGGTRQEPEVYYSGFWSQGDGASFVGRYEYVKGSVDILAKEAPPGEGKSHEGNNELNRIARELRDVQRSNFYRLVAHVGRGRSNYSHSMTMDIDVERTDSVNVSDEDIETVKQCLKDFADWIYRSLEREYDHENSDETVDESIRANEYEFTEDGRVA